MMNSQTRRVGAAEVFEALQTLKHEGYNVLMDLTAIDWSAAGAQAPGARRFEVVYRLAKIDPDTGNDNGRVEVRCFVNDSSAELRSAARLWPIADWLEREVWDMFGIRFADRPGIKRLLLYESFEGHPLCKDYPIAKRQPLIGPAAGEPANNPSFNSAAPTVKYE